VLRKQSEEGSLARSSGLSVELPIRNADLVVIHSCLKLLKKIQKIFKEGVIRAADTTLFLKKVESPKS